MKKYILAPALLSLLALSSCATGLRSPLTGFVYSDILSSESVTSNQAGNRRGRSLRSVLLRIGRHGRRQRGNRSQERRHHPN